MIDVSVVQIVIWLASLVLVVIPMGRIFQRAGFSWTWGLLLFVPFLGWLAAWLILANRTWRWRRAG